MGRVTQMPAHDFEEGRIATRRPGGRCVSQYERSKSDDPQPQAEADRGSERPIEDGDGARGAGDQDRLGQAAMDRRGESGREVMADEVRALSGIGGVTVSQKRT